MAEDQQDLSLYNTLVNKQSYKQFLQQEMYKAYYANNGKTTTEASFNYNQQQLRRGLIKDSS